MPFSDPVFNGPPPIPVEDMFPGGYWRHWAVLRLAIYFFTRVNILWWFRQAWHPLLRVWDWAWKMTRWPRKKNRTGVMLRFLRLSVNLIRSLDWWWATKMWWQLHYCIADLHDAEENYLEAWAANLELQAPGRAARLHLFVGGEYVFAPIPIKRDWDDAAVLARLRMWYRLLQSRQGLAEVLLPKRLTRVDKVKVSNTGNQVTIISGRVETLVMGRVGHSQVAWLEKPQNAAGEHTVQEQLSSMTDKDGLEFIRSWNTAAVSAITMLPFVLSVIFAATWIRYAHRDENEGFQVVVTTAVGIASYTVIAGSLLIALVTFIDSQSPKESYDLAEQVVRLTQPTSRPVLAQAQQAALQQPVQFQQAQQLAQAQQPARAHQAQQPPPVRAHSA